MRKRSFVLLLTMLLWGTFLVQAATVQVSSTDAPEELAGNASTFWQIDYWDVNGNGTAPSPSYSFAAHPSSLAGGFNPSSLRMVTGSGVDGAAVGCARPGGKVFLGTQDLNGLRVGDIGDLSYSLLVDSTNGTPGADNLAPYINIFIDLNNDGVWSGANDSILVFDPLYNVSTAGSPTAHAVNGAFVQDSWYTFDPGPGGNGEWHTAAQPIPGIGAGNPALGANRTWDQIMAVAFGGGTVADLEIVNPNNSGCGVHGDEGTQSGLAFVTGQKNGTLWYDHASFIDNITFSHSGASIPTTTYDLTADAWQLVFTTQPSNANTNAAISPDIVVQIQDSSGAVVTGATSTVNLAINNNPGAGTLAGTVSVAAVNGVATFSGLSINNAGIGYTLDASSTGLSTVTSTAFDIAAAPTPTTVVVTPSDQQGWIIGNGALNPVTSGYETGPGAPTAGIGSFFTQVTVNNSKISMAVPNAAPDVPAPYANQTLASLTSISYSTYLDVAAQLTDQWYVNIYVDQNGDGTSDCRLDFAPTASALDVWDSYTITNATTVNRGTASCTGGSGSITLGAFKTANPNARLLAFSNAANPPIVFNIGDTGSNYVGVDGNIDNIHIITSSSDMTWDFEPGVPAIGAAKTISGAGTGPWTLTVNLLVENLGDVALTNVQAVENLAVFGTSGVDWILGAVNVSSANVSVTPNGAFDGVGDTNLLGAGSNLNPGETISITITLTVNTAGTYSNQIQAQGFVGATPYTDLSDNGTVTDSNGNSLGNDAGEDDPSPIVLTTGVPPVGGGGGGTGGSTTGTGSGTGIRLDANGISAVSSNGAGFAFPGATVVWTFTVQNVSGGQIDNVVARVVYPDDDMVGIQATSDKGIVGVFSRGSLIVDYNLGSMSAGEIIRLNITTQLPERAGVFIGTLTVSASGVPEDTAVLTIATVSNLPSTGETPRWAIILRDVLSTMEAMLSLAR